MILPELRGTIEFYVVVASITMLAWVFAYVYTITQGGPGTSSTVLELYIYNQGLRNSLPGMASAVAVVLLGATMSSSRCCSRPLARPRAERGWQRRAPSTPSLGGAAGRVDYAQAGAADRGRDRSRSTRSGSWSRRRSRRQEQYLDDPLRPAVAARRSANFGDAVHGGDVPHSG